MKPLSFKWFTSWYLIHNMTCFFNLLVSNRPTVVPCETQQCIHSLPPEERVGGARTKDRGRGRARGTGSLFRPSTVVCQAERRGRGGGREICGAEEVLQEAAVAMATELSRWPDSSEHGTMKGGGGNTKKKHIFKSVLTCWLEKCVRARVGVWMNLSISASQHCPPAGERDADGALGLINVSTL